MTDPTTKPTDASTPKRSRTATAAIRPALVLIFRLLLLGVGSAAALVIGVLVAQISPGSVDRQPLLENVLRGVARFRGMPYPQVEQSPDPGEVDDSPSPADASESSDGSGSVDLPDRANSPDGGSAPDSPDASDVPRSADADVAPVLQENQSLRQQLVQLRSEQQDLEEAIAQLEARVGIEPSAAPLDVRMAELERLLGGAQRVPQGNNQN